MSREEAEWMLALVREVFRPDGPREDRLVMLDRGEIPPDDGGDNGDA